MANDVSSVEPAAQADRAIAADAARIAASDLFDAAYYEAHCEVAIPEGQTAAEHYLEIGATLGHDPSALFSTRVYLERNPDVARARYNPLLHFLVHGRSEGRAAPPAEPAPVPAPAGEEAGTLAFVETMASFPPGDAGHRALARLFLSIVDRLRPAIFCDVGANQGEVGRAVAERLPDCTVLGLEANPRIHAHFARENRDAGILWQNCAASDADGAVEIHVPTRLSRFYADGALHAGEVLEGPLTGKSSLLRRDEDASYETVSVPGRRLDTILADLAGAVDGRVALWIDVEGAASRVLDGAPETLARCDAILLEVEGVAFWRDQATAGATIDRLVELGFEPIARDREYANAQFNVALVRGACIDGEMVAACDAALADAHREAGPGAAPALVGVAPEPRTVPVLVPSFENPTHCARMVAQLTRLGFRDITLVDNASRSTAMRAFLEGTDAKVERLERNLGPHRSIFTPDRLAGLPRRFCVTDPDLVFNRFMPHDFLAQLALVAAHHGRGKAALALDISRRHALRTQTFAIDGARYRIWEWEEQFWRHRLPDLATDTGDPVFDAQTDTTFALYDQDHFDPYGEEGFDPARFLRAYRIAGRFTATHTPWLAAADIPPEEARIYGERQDFSYYAR